MKPRSAFLCPTSVAPAASLAPSSVGPAWKARRSSSPSTRARRRRSSRKPITPSSATSSTYCRSAKGRLMPRAYRLTPPPKACRPGSELGLLPGLQFCGTGKISRAQKREQMLHLITASNFQSYRDEMEKTFRLLHKVFVEETRWENLHRPHGRDCRPGTTTLPFSSQPISCAAKRSNVLI